MSHSSHLAHLGHIAFHGIGGTAAITGDLLLLGLV